MHRGQAKIKPKPAEFRVRMQPATLRSDFHGGEPQVGTLARHFKRPAGPQSGLLRRNILHRLVLPRSNACLQCSSSASSYLP